MEEELQNSLDEIMNSTFVGVDVKRPSEAAIEQITKMDKQFKISDPTLIPYLIAFYTAAKGYYSQKYMEKVMSIIKDRESHPLFEDQY